MKNIYRKWMAGKLRKARTEKKLSQQEFADGIQVKRCTYAAYEEGRSEPSIFTIERICAYLGITTDVFLIDSPYKAKASC